MVVLAVHGGAGVMNRSDLSPEKEKAIHQSLTNALDAGYQVLATGGSALDAVEQAVRALEDAEHFNAGRGAVFTADGRHEMDASLMDGKTLKAGAVAGVRNVRNPITLARTVMDKSDYVLLMAPGAEDFARQHNLSFEPDEYFYTETRYQELKKKQSGEGGNRKIGTVGAVALDQSGNLAAATSTGGMTNKTFGRLGDSPVIGAGTYANNRACAVSCTGDGEYFIRAVAAYDVYCLMAYKGLSLQEACRIVVHEKLKELEGEGGLIAVDRDGNLEMAFNSEGMYRGWRNEQGEGETAIF
ncbi:isoaspartyl peptidase/L-asparaginase [Nibrella viscosa]|uniref:Isoaspartyl peptidase/L-asparaginase n=1 Tax=Nibrella viscosa TaxID=1084524 RepID=A0ABP8K247_9BACT